MGIIYGREEEISLGGVGYIALPVSLSDYECQEKSRKTHDSGLVA